MDKKREWECSRCEVITSERIDPIHKDFTGYSIPLFGWACISGCGIKGRRYLTRGKIKKCKRHRGCSNEKEKQHKKQNKKKSKSMRGRRFD